MSYTTLFLDLDNTLLDFSKAEYHAIKTVLKNYGLPDDDKTAKIYSEINLSFWKRFEKGEIEKSEIFEGRFNRLAEVLGADIDVSAISKDYCLNLAEAHYTVDGAEEILTYLKAKGYYLCATTNGLSVTQYKRIKNSGIEPYFNKIFVSEDTGHQKPEKEYFDFVINSIPEKNRDNMLIIGDSQSSDILGGINSGIDTCWYNPYNDTPKYQSRYEIKALAELKTIL